MIPLVYHPLYSQLDLPSKHRYPINKYRLLYQALQERMKQDPEWESAFHFFTPQPVTVDEVKMLHDADYVDALVQGTLPVAKMRRIGFPWSDALITRTLTSAGGTCLTAKLAVEHGVALHLSGGYHHYCGGFDGG